MNFFLYLKSKNVVIPVSTLKMMLPPFPPSPPSGPPSGTYFSLLNVIAPAPPVPDFVMKAAFGNRASEYVSTMEVWEIELAAYFSLIDENMDAAKRLYEYAVFETGGVNALQKNNAIIAISPLAQVTSATNLAMLYAASGDLKKSVSLFGLASGRTRDKKIKSRILYKTALVQIDLGNTDEAVLSLNYAISLDPMNANARLLRKKIK